MQNNPTGVPSQPAPQEFQLVMGNQNPIVPKATVAISLYNYQEAIAACLDTVKAQTIPDLDLIVVDDRSKDGSLDAARDWLEQHGDRFNRYLLLAHRENQGLSAARNTGFSQARTEYVFVLDADNQIYPRCVERLASALDCTDASFAYCYLETFGAAQKLMNTRPWDPGSFQTTNPIDAMVLLRRSVWEQVGGYSKMDNLGWEDFDLWFKISRAGGWGIQVPEILARYSIHESSMIRQVTLQHTARLWGILRARYPEFFTAVPQ